MNACLCLDPRFCLNCGRPLERLQTTTSWEGRWRCSCGTRYKVERGDHMGGSGDQLLVFSQPFENEVCRESVETPNLTSEPASFNVGEKPSK